MLFRSSWFVAILCCLAGTAFANSLKEPTQRAQRWELNFQPKYIFGKDVDATNSSAKIDDVVGWGFGVAYNVNDQLDLGLEFTRSDPNYTATITSDDPNPETRKIGGSLSGNGILFAAGYNIMPKRFTPYVRGSLGWAWVNTGIPSGAPEVGCWWDPWYGYVCAPYQSTYNSTALAYRIGAGLRYEAGRAFYMRVGYDLNGLHFENADGASLFHQVRLDFGLLMD